MTTYSEATKLAWDMVNIVKDELKGAELIPRDEPELSAIQCAAMTATILRILGRIDSTDLMLIQGFLRGEQ